MVLSGESVFNFRMPQKHGKINIFIQTYNLIQQNVFRNEGVLGFWGFGVLVVVSQQLRCSVFSDSFRMVEGALMRNDAARRSLWSGRCSAASGRTCN